MIDAAAAEGVVATCCWVVLNVALYDSLSNYQQFVAGMMGFNDSLLALGSKITTKTHGYGAGNQLCHTTIDDNLSVTKS